MSTVGAVGTGGGRGMSGEHAVEDVDGSCGAAERLGIGVVGIGVDADGIV